MFLMSRNFIAHRIGKIHFVGIGGIGMSGIAEILHNLGYSVQGSDASLSAQVKHLQDIGIKVFVGHDAENLGDSKVLVRSSAVGFDNPEVKQAKELGIPIIQRAEMLAELMRLKASIAIAGTHGKTTTTSLVASIFEQEGLSPTVINGGIINSKLTNAYLGEGDFLIAEADESDGTFTKLPSTIVVVTNINKDHMEYFGDFKTLKEYFCKFIENIPFYGFAVLCKDHKVVAELSEEITDRRILTYGINNSDVDVFADNIQTAEDGMYFDVIVSNKLSYPQKEIKNCFIPVMGMHNVQNSLAAITIALELNFDIDNIINGFKNFKGVKRRFTTTGEVGGIRIIDDYAHHPEEIKATIATAKQVVSKTGGKVIAVFQPHRYTRFNNLFSEFTHAFDEADILFVADIYSAGEQPIPGIRKELLIEAINQRNHKINIKSLDNHEELAKHILSNAKNGDLVLCMGAGSITTWANSLPAQMIDLTQVSY